MIYTGKPEFMEPDALVNDDCVLMLAQLKSDATEHGLYNALGADLFLVLAEYKRLVDAFAVYDKAIKSSPGAIQQDTRQSMAATFRRVCLEGNDIAPRVARFVDYLADLIEG